MNDTCEDELFVPQKMIDKAKKSKFGEVWYTDKGAIFITATEGMIVPLFSNRDSQVKFTWLK